jgi:glutamyl-tRNA synthetase
MKPEARRALAAVLDALRGTDRFDAATLEGLLGEAVERVGERPKNVYQPVRVAITGTSVSPGIFDSLAALGREESVRRIEAAIERLDA